MIEGAISKMPETVGVALEVIAGAVTILPLLGDQISNIVRLAVFVLWCMGIYRAATWRTDPLPIVGEINLVR